MERSVLKEERFAQNVSLEDCRKAIAGRREFRETVKDDLLVFNYDFCFGSTFPDPSQEPDQELRNLYKIRRECRGIIFDKNTGKVVSRRLHKFFNIGENSETSHQSLDLSRPYVITEKVDGCLITPVYTWGKIRLASKNGPTKFSHQVEEHYLTKVAQTMKFMEFFEHWMAKDYSLIFEWISPQTPIVLTYEEDALILIAIRHNITGHYILYDEMVKSADSFGIPVVKKWKGSSEHPKLETIEDFMSLVKNEKGIEGCVLRFDDGDMYKVKTEWYFSQSKSMLALPNNFGSEIGRSVTSVVERDEREVGPIYEGIICWFHPKDFMVDIFQGIDVTAHRLSQELESIRLEKPIKKDFVKWMQERKTDGRRFLDKEVIGFVGAVFSVYSRLYEGMDPRSQVIDVMKSCCGVKKFENTRNAFQLAHINFFKTAFENVDRE